MVKIILFFGEILLTITSLPGSTPANHITVFAVSGLNNFDVHYENKVGFVHAIPDKSYEKYSHKVYNFQKIQARQSFNERIKFTNEEVATKLKIFNKYINYKFKINKLYRNKYNKFI